MVARNRFLGYWALPCLVPALLFGRLAATAAAQSTFELSAPELGRTSIATVTERELRVVDQNGRSTLYFRDPRTDSSDGQFLGYRNSASGQIVRWPVAGNGRMQIGTAVAGIVEYRTSQMRIVPLAAPPAPAGGQVVGGQALGPIAGMPSTNAAAGESAFSPAAASDLFEQVWQRREAQPRQLRLATRDQRGEPLYLGSAGDNRLTMFPSGNIRQSDWVVVPAARGYVRVQQIYGSQWRALTASPQRTLDLRPVAQDAGQLWRVVHSNTVAGGYWLESAVVAGVALTGAPTGVVNLLPIGASVGQVWWPMPAPVAVGYEPLWRTVSHEVRANPPLPPAQIDLLNTHSSPLLVLIGDRRNAGVQQVRIEPASQSTVAFDRDAGATIVETYEIRGPSGLWDRQQFVTPIPPAPIYDLSVYEIFLQSIAIDRTGTSPNPIEDVNYQPRSIGWVPLPPGTGLPERGQFDVFAQARAANNPGAVRRIDPRSLEKPAATPDPLEAKLQEFAPPPPVPSPSAPASPLPSSESPTRKKF